MISIVCPFYNEQDAIGPFIASVVPVMESLGEDFELVCVNDGSRDSTLDLLVSAAQHDPRIRIVDLSRNFGKEAALTAGLDHARGDAVVPIDADLQDPPQVIVEFVKLWREGFEVVIGRRLDRSADSWGKRVAARMFYRVHNRIADVPIPEDVGDFRLLDRCVVDALRAMPERRRFMKGLFAWVGFRTAVVDYARAPRVAGKSKFNGWTLWNFAIEGITAFSTAPLRVWTYLGLGMAAAAFVYAGFIIVRTIVLGIDVPGYASLITIILLIGGMQLAGLGVIGEYVGRVYAESKQRPIYVVRRSFEGNRGGASPRQVHSRDRRDSDATRSSDTRCG